MNIGGFEKYSFIDYPGLISSVIFTAGCNFHCPYCHNPELVGKGCGTLPAASVSLDAIFSFLERRKKFVEGVVISGGEPTLQKGLAELCRELQRMGLLVKLDTNGSLPGVLADLLNRGLIDYIAMDIKTDPDRYSPIISSDAVAANIHDSINLVLSSGVPHEFRTTCVHPVVDLNAFRAIARIVRGAFLYALQVPRIGNGKDILDFSFFNRSGSVSGDAELQGFRTVLSASVESCIIR